MEYPSLGTPPAGSIRFNTDSSKMEIYNGDKWWEIDSTSPTEQTGGTRGLLMGGNNPGLVDIIEYIQINTTGNSVDFGNLTAAHARGSSVGSRTRGIRAGGYNPSSINTIEFVTFSSTGNAANFGDLNNAVRFPAPMSNTTRGVFAGGYTPTNTDAIDYITMATEGDAVDFGNLSFARNRSAGVESPTRGIIAGGAVPSPSPYDEGGNIIDYITISTTGNSSDFGDLTLPKFQYEAAGNATRGICYAGRTQPAGGVINVIDYITIATLGNAQDFGDASVTLAANAVCSSSTRVVSGGGANPSLTNLIEYVHIMTTGNGIDFGDMTHAPQNLSGCSNGHGGLG